MNLTSFDFEVTEE